MFFTSSQLSTLSKAVLIAFRDASCTERSKLALPSLSMMTLKFFVNADLSQTARSCVDWVAQHCCGRPDVALYGVSDAERTAFAADVKLSGHQSQ